MQGQLTQRCARAAGLGRLPACGRVRAEALERNGLIDLRGAGLAPKAPVTVKLQRDCMGRRERWSARLRVMAPPRGAA